jgi:hypothetical protein
MPNLQLVLHFGKQKPNITLDNFNDSMLSFKQFEGMTDAKSNTRIQEHVLQLAIQLFQTKRI